MCLHRMHLGSVSSKQKRNARDNLLMLHRDTKKRIGLGPPSVPIVALITHGRRILMRRWDKARQLLAGISK